MQYESQDRPWSADGRAAPLTLGEWVEIAARDGVSADRRWRLALDHARAALPAVRGRLRRDDEDDLVSDLLVVAHELPESWRRPEVRDVPLARWFAGVLRVLRVERRGRSPDPPRKSCADEDFPDRVREPDAAAPDVSIDDELRPFVTARELRSIDAFRRGLDAVEAAKSLGIRVGAHRARLRRALRRVRNAVVPRPPDDSSWIPATVRLLLDRGDRDGAALLLLRDSGKSLAECAASFRTTADAVKARLRRARGVWRMWKTSPARRARDTRVHASPLWADGLADEPVRIGAPDGVRTDAASWERFPVDPPPQV
jgi:DNA-directed RNA polymerase specialized sigma24 family protein